MLFLCWKMKQSLRIKHHGRRTLCWRLPPPLLVSVFWMMRWTVIPSNLGWSDAWLSSGPTTIRRSGRTQLRPWSTQAGSLSQARYEAHPNGHDRPGSGPEKLNVRLLVIDHYDSFTYNLVHLLSQYCQTPPRVVAADAASTWEQLLAQLEEEDDDPKEDGTGPAPFFFDGLILSPGPGDANDLLATQLARDAIRQNPHLPILGVCLGHQILGSVYGATVQVAPEPVHGQVRPIRRVGSWGQLPENSPRGEEGIVHQEKDDDILWEGIPHQTDLWVTRYHSWHVTDWPADLIIPTAVTAPYRVDGEEADQGRPVLMALKHATYPHVGVQFHPESIGSTTWGPQILYNFCRLCDQLRLCRYAPLVPPTVVGRSDPGASVFVNNINHPGEPSSSSSPPADPSPLAVYIHRVPRRPGQTSHWTPSRVMDRWLAQEDYSFWLDDARADPKVASISILGASHERVEYYGQEQPLCRQGLYRWKEDQLVESHMGADHDVLTYLQQCHNQPTNSFTWVSTWDEHGVAVCQTRREEELALPFDYRGGHVGFLSYEVRYDTARYLQKQEGVVLPSSPPPTSQRPPAVSSDYMPERHENESVIPTAAFLWADKSLVYDHQKDDWYLVGVTRTGKGPDMDRLLSWMKATSWQLQREYCQVNYSNSAAPRKSLPHKFRKGPWLKPMFSPNRSRETYNLNFEACLGHIRQGESYELCLTNQLETVVSSPQGTPLDLYRILRQRNPAPHAAFLNWKGRKQLHSVDDDTSSPNAAFAICCSSPERFVAVKRDPSGTTTMNKSHLLVEAKPIKGTSARVLPSSGLTLTEEELAQDQLSAYKLQWSIKNRAENLMIVDLLRNDLSRVCEAGSVHVSKLMEIESFATVHQMVSTIRGTLDPARTTAVEVLRACFPGGSMTGAPKLRTMELLHELEEAVSRGPYSGCLGYISVNGCMDMNIIIRTAVLKPVRWTGHQEGYHVSIGAGGAITALSTSSDEYEEMLLKASAVMKAVQEWAATSSARPGGPTPISPELVVAKTLGAPGEK